LITDIRINFDTVRRMVSAAEDLYEAGEREDAKSVLLKLADNIRGELMPKKPSKPAKPMKPKGGKGC
jgi:hypothetical protein